MRDVSGYSGDFRSKPTPRDLRDRLSRSGGGGDRASVRPPYHKGVEDGIPKKSSGDRPDPRDVAAAIGARRRNDSVRSPLDQQADTPERPNPRDVAAVLAAKGDDRIHPPSNKQSDAPVKQSDVVEQPDGYLTRLAQGTDLVENDRVVSNLNKLSNIDTSAFSERLRSLTEELQGEISGAIKAYKSGQGMDRESLQNVIIRIGAPYMMAEHGTYLEDSLIRVATGVLTELDQVKRIVESKLSVSSILLGTQGNRIQGNEAHILKNTSTGASETVRLTPINEADLLYLGNDGKVHVREVKTTARALQKTFDSSPDQLTNLAIWRDHVPEKRDALVVLRSEKEWTALFSSSQSVTDVLTTLVECRIPIQIGSALFSPEDLLALKEKVDRALSEEKKQSPRAVLSRLSRKSPKDVQQGRF